MDPARLNDLAHPADLHGPVAKLQAVGGDTASFGVVTRWQAMDRPSLSGLGLERMTEPQHMGIRGREDGTRHFRTGQNFVSRLRPVFADKRFDDFLNDHFGVVNVDMSVFAKIGRIDAWVEPAQVAEMFAGRMLIAGSA